MASKFFTGLSQGFSQLLNDADDDYNVIIKVGENSNTKEFHAHSNILRARSPYFKIAFSQNKLKMIFLTLLNLIFLPLYLR